MAASPRTERKEKGGLAAALFYLTGSLLPLTRTASRGSAVVQCPPATAPAPRNQT